MLFANAKYSVHGMMPTLAYRIETIVVGQDPERHNNIVAPFVEWLGEVNITADQAVGAAAGGGDKKKQRGEQDRVQDFLCSRHGEGAAGPVGWYAGRVGKACDRGGRKTRLHGEATQDRPQEYVHRREANEEGLGVV